MDVHSQQHALDRITRGERLSRRALFAALAACGLGVTSIDLLAGLLGPGTQGEAESVPPSAALYLCLIVLDGFRPEYLNLAPTPAVDALAGRGVFYERAWVGQLETETPAGHATLSTGVYPRHDGIIGFEWRDPVTRREVMDGWEMPNGVGKIGLDMQRVHGNSIPQAVKLANPGATVVSLSSEKIYAADAMAAGTADYAFYHRRVAGRLVPATVTGFVPPPELLSQPGLSLPLPLQRFSDWDRLAGRVARASLAALLPDVLMVNLPGSDFYGHKFGGLDSPAVMAKVVAGQDRQIGKLFDAYREAGIFDQTLFVLTADHGMVPNHHELNPKMVSAVGQETGAQILFHTGGTGKYVYLDDRSRRKARKVARGIARLPTITSTYFRNGDGDYEPAGTRPDPLLDAAYRYLFSTFNGARGPDVVAAYRENTIGSVYPQLYGNHGGMSWGTHQIPLILAGPGVRRGFRSKAPARLVDVAPTVMRLLGMNLPGQDGTVLADALTHPTLLELAAQASHVTALNRHQDALRELAAEEIRQDRKRGIKPLPSVAVTP